MVERGIVERDDQWVWWNGVTSGYGGKGRPVGMVERGDQGVGRKGVTSGYDGKGQCQSMMRSGFI